LCDRDDRSLNPLIDEVVETCEAIDEAIAAVRRIATGLRPAALDHLGLSAALDEEAEQFTRRTGIPCELKVGELDETIPPQVETAAFRIFQESLTNVARHSQATRAEAACGVRDRKLVLSVRDDGVGLTPALVGSPDSLGLMGMSERAADAGGRVEFKPAAGRGTEVLLTIPLGNVIHPPTPIQP
jgi:signal transduction histidine kinase